MWLREKEFVIRLGGNTYIDVPILIAFKGIPIFGVVRQDDGYLAMDFEVFSSTGERIAAVKRNNIYIADRDKYRLDGDADRLRLIEKGTEPKTLVDITKGAAAEPVEIKVSVRSFLPNGQLMDLGPNESNLGGIKLVNNIIQRCSVGIAIDG